MYRSRPVEDPVRRWRRFSRAGRRLALAAGVLWGGLWVFLLGVAPAPEPLPRAEPPQVAWWPDGAPVGAEGSGATDVRTLWTPSAFALPTPAGFSHSLRHGRARLTPPVQTQPPGPSFLVAEEVSSAPVPAAAPRLRLSTASEPGRHWAAPGVFPPRPPESEAPRMGFPDGWESRLFSGVDLNFGAWTNQGWTARMEMTFDSAGVPQSMLLVQSSGLPEVDRRLVRAAQGWRLLEPEAPRAGIVAWSSPATSAPPAAAPGSGGRSP